MGPVVTGMEDMASRQPMDCDAPLGPTISKAMGPRRDKKQPSKRPIIRVMTMKNEKLLAMTKSIVRLPMIKNDIC